MYNLKGFIRINDLVSNVTGEVSLLGEMSPIALSYAKEKGYYNLFDVNGIELVSMSGKLDSVIAPVPDEVSALSIKVGKWALDNSTNSGLMGEVSGAYPDYMAALTAYFTGVTFVDEEFAALTMGPMVTIEVPLATDIMIPEWIAFTMVYDDGPSEYPATVKVWFSDLAFRNQFDEYQIEVVPPIDDLDDFFLTYSAVLALVDAYTRPVQAEKIATTIGFHPPTLTKVMMYNWNDLEDPPNLIPTPWAVVIYGLAGNNNDLIVAAIRQYILDNSTHLLGEWLLRFPDIFKTTEFTVTPMWNRYSIDNMTLQAGVHSPMVNFNQDIDEVLATMPTYAEPHVRLHTMSGIFMYKSLSFYTVGSADNRDDQFDFTDVFDDYIAVSTDSLDFGKMSPITQGWVLFITELLQIAETMTEFSDIPFTCTRIIRSGVMYIAASYDDIQYLITSKEYFTDNVLPPEDL